ncbi:hypothetical protein Pcinc_009509 [Petrolisthes cinctipes]|uniref:Uncharacterized protein n=1 Tax=Petrolisthes cinctipes TaxID=88211 RepID=A0AAE1G4L8_PETCI|nr:hypothetical protein Pcinc_009509 [Petrolisthes cinctipes]
MNSSQGSGHSRRVSSSGPSTPSNDQSIISNLQYIQKHGQSIDEESVIFNPREVQRHVIKNTEEYLHRIYNTHQQSSFPASLYSFQSQHNVPSKGTQEGIPQSQHYIRTPSGSTSYERKRSPHLESHHKGRPRQESKKLDHKLPEVQFQGFNNRYVGQKLQKEQLHHTDGGLLKFLSLNSHLSLKTGWKKEIIPRKTLSDNVTPSTSANQTRLQLKDVSLSDIPTTQYNLSDHSEEELEDILGPLSQLPDFDKNIEVEADYTRNHSRVSDCDRDVIRIFNRNSDDFFVAPEPTTSQHLHLPDNRNNLTPSSESSNEPLDSDEERERYRTPNVITSLGSVLAMLNRRQASLQNGEEAATQSREKLQHTRQETVVASRYDQEKIKAKDIQQRKSEPRTSLGREERDQPAKECGNVNITSFDGKIKTSRPKPVGVPNRRLIDKQLLVSRQISSEKPMDTAENGSNEHMTSEGEGSGDSNRLRSKQGNGNQIDNDDSFKSIEADSQKESSSQKRCSSASNRSETEYNLYRYLDKEEGRNEETNVGGNEINKIGSSSHSSQKRKSSENWESSSKRRVEKRTHSPKRKYYENNSNEREGNKEKKQRALDDGDNISSETLGKDNSSEKHKDKEQLPESDNVKNTKTERYDKKSSNRHDDGDVGKNHQDHSSSSPQKPCSQYRNKRNQQQSLKSIICERSSRDERPSQSEGVTDIKAKYKAVEEAQENERKKRVMENRIQRVETTGNVDVSSFSTRQQKLSVASESSTLPGTITQLSSYGLREKQLPVNDASINTMAVKPCPDDNRSYGSYEPLFRDLPQVGPVTVKDETLSPEQQPQSHMDDDCILQRIFNSKNHLWTHESIDKKLPMEGSTSISGQSELGKRCSTEFIEKSEHFEIVDDASDMIEVKMKELSCYTKEVLRNGNMHESEDPYKDLQRSLKYFGYPIWEDGDDLVYNWEVNLRWLMVKVFDSKADFNTFSKNIKFYMANYPSISQFANYVKGELHKSNS